MSVTHWICVSNADSGQLSLLRRHGDGLLTLEQTLELGGQLMPMAHCAARSLFYVARRSDPLGVIALKLDRHSGRLSVLGEAALPASMAYISLDPSGRYLLASSYHDDLVSVSAIAPDGRVAPAHQRLATGRHAHCVVAAPASAWVLAACLGADQLQSFRFDPSEGLLRPSAGPAWQGAQGSGPRHLRFHAGRVFLLNELDATLQVFAFDPATAALELLHTESVWPPGFAGKPWAAELKLTADGRFLYCSERSSSTVALFAVSSQGPALRKIGHLQTEAQPRGMAVCGSEQLLVVGQVSDHLSSYRIDRLSGELQLQQRLPLGRNPNWIEVMPA